MCQNESFSKNPLDNVSLRHYNCVITKHKGGDCLRMWLKERRETLQKTHDDVASSAGISRGHYNNIENGERNPTVEKAQKKTEAPGLDWAMVYDEDIRAKEITQDSNKNKKQNANQTIA